MSSSSVVLIKSKCGRPSIKTKVFQAIRAAICPCAPRGSADRLLSTIDELLLFVGVCDTKPTQDIATKNSLAPVYPFEQDSGSLKTLRMERKTGPSLCQDTEFPNRLHISSFNESPNTLKNPKCNSVPPSPSLASPLAPLTSRADFAAQGNGIFAEPFGMDCKRNPAEHKCATKLNEDQDREFNTSIHNDLPQLVSQSRSCSPSLMPLNLSPLPFLPSAPGRNVGRNSSGSRPEPVITRSISKKKRSAAIHRQSGV